MWAEIDELPGFDAGLVHDIQKGGGSLGEEEEWSEEKEWYGLLQSRRPDRLSALIDHAGRSYICARLFFSRDESPQQASEALALLCGGAAFGCG